MPSRASWILSTLCAVVTVAASPPDGGVPLLRGMVWTGQGIGASARGGADAAGLGSPMLAMEGIGWYHYYPGLIAGAGFRLSSASIGSDATLFTAQYEIHSTMTWAIGNHTAFQADLPLRVSRKDYYVDTLDGADPFALSRNGYGSGFLVAVGTRRGDMGFTIGGGCNWTWWPGSDSARNLDVVWELEPSVSLGMRGMWPHSDSLSKAFDVAVSFPFQYAVLRMESPRPQGRAYDADPFRVGVRIGLAVVL